MGGVKEYAFSHAECPICGRCYLPWETKSGITCGRPECDDETNQLFEEIADNNNKENDNARRSSNGEVDRTSSLSSEKITTRKASGNAREDVE